MSGIRLVSRCAATMIAVMALTGCGGEPTLKPADVPSASDAPTGVLAPAQDASTAADAANEAIHQQQTDVGATQVEE